VFNAHFFLGKHSSYGNVPPMIRYRCFC